MTLRHSRQSDLFSRKTLKRRRAKQDSKKRRRLELETLESRQLLTTGPQLIGIQPNDGSLLNNGDVRDVAPSDLTFRFDENAVLDVDTLDAIRLTGAGPDDAFNTIDDVPIVPGFLGLGETSHEVIMRFAQPLPDDKYRITIDGTTANALRDEGGEVFNDGEDFARDFELDLGAKVIAIVPQPVERVGGVLTQRRDQVVVYFNDDDLNVASAENPAFYQLFFTNDTTSNLDDLQFAPTTVDYDAATDRVTLTFASNIDELAPDGFGTFRIRIGTDEARPVAPVAIAVATDPADTFTGALDIGTLTNQGQLLTEEIVNTTPYPFEFPGALDQPGSRDIRAEDHILGGDTGFIGDVQAGDGDGIALIAYNFQDLYGSDPQGNVLQNAITENQKQRTREIFELYSEYIGAEFVETDASGLTIVTGDLRALDPAIDTDATLGLAGGGVAIMNNNVTWSDTFGADWFRVAMHEIGHLLGLGHSGELAPITIQNGGGGSPLGFNNPAEPDFPGQHDITHGTYLFRPESKDIDLYEFTIDDAGTFTAEIIAERRSNSSLLDSRLAVYQNVPGGVPVLIAQNDDYYSEDAFIGLDLAPGDYFVAVSASLNDDFNPLIEDSGIGGTSQGAYDLRLDFRPSADSTIVDADLAPTGFDGDNDGVAGGVYNFWFRAAPPVGTVGSDPNDPQTLFVDKNASPGGDGSLAAPFRTVSFDAASAFQNANPGDIVRLVGNGGFDGDITTIGDNEAYEFGTNQIGQTLRDGVEMVVPKGITVMVDEGAIFKFRESSVSVGSSTLGTPETDRSGGAFQVLGTPDNTVFFTSLNDQVTGKDNDPFSTVPGPRDWGGIAFQQNLDRAEGRFVWENRAIFLDYVNHASIRFGGGEVSRDGSDQVVSPIQLTRARPTISYNTISQNGDAAISADPDSFAESNFHSPDFQLTQVFTSDFDRVGPDIDANLVINNTTNGLFIRAAISGGTETTPMTVSGRWDDTSITHVVTDKLEVRGTAGGPTFEQVVPPTKVVTLTEVAGGGSLPAGTYNYRITFIDAAGSEGATSDATRSLTIGAGGAIQLENLPTVEAPFVARRLYRLDPPTGDYVLVTELDGSDSDFLDDGTTEGGVLVPQAFNFRARRDARLAIDPSTVVKLGGGRIEATFGAQLLAEGLDGQEVIFTSINDGRFGAGGTFDVSDNGQGATLADPEPGDWGGILIGHASTASIDNALITYGGGSTTIQGGFAPFNVFEVHQARARLTNSILEFNADGSGTTTDVTRVGRGFNEPSTIFVRTAQPIIVNNVIRNNDGPAVSINANALSETLVRDYGRSVGEIARIQSFGDNQGPLIRDNRLNLNGLNGMAVRGETMTTAGVWDDTDIVHALLNDTIFVSEFEHEGGLRLESNPTQSLVVKLSGPNAGFVANGRALDIDDRIGGAIQIVGQPGNPVVFTSLADDSVGAGFRSADGEPQTDTNNDGSATSPSPGDWNSISLQEFSHDRNVEVVLEQEPVDVVAPGPNAFPTSAQAIGELAPHEKGGDDLLRLGFQVHGFLNSPNDVDVYSIKAEAGTEVWFDMDRTRHSLDAVIEVIDAGGNLVARSDNSHQEALQNEAIVIPDPTTDANVLGKSTYTIKDHWTTNQRDAGLRVVLPGTAGNVSTFYVRVRSSSSVLDSNLEGGLTSGSYEFQIRLQELDEIPGSTIRFADIRYATTGIEVLGLPIHSPLLGEATEAGDASNTTGGAQPLGNLLTSDRASLAISGFIGTSDVDVYEFEIDYDSVQSDDGQHLATVLDIDYADGLGRADMSLALFKQVGSGLELVAVSKGVSTGSNSNIAEDQPGPLEGVDIDDLSRGSAGQLDPYIGSYELEIGTYFAAVMARNQMPTQLAQFTTAAPANTLVRLEPIDVLDRIAEDHIGGGDLFDDSSIVPFSLGDVTLFVSQDQGLAPNTAANIRSVNPFTGGQETIVGSLTTGSGSPFIGDIALRWDGSLFTFSEGYLFQNDTDANIGNFIEIDTGDGSGTVINDDGIETYVPSATGGDDRAPFGNVNTGVGVLFEAITFNGNGGLDLFAVGNRGDFPLGSVTRERNILYRFETFTGEASSATSIDRGGCDNDCRYVGAGTQIVERGQLSTETTVTSDIVEATVAPPIPSPADQSNYNFVDGDEIEVSYLAGSQSQVFEFETGYELIIETDPTGDIETDILRDGDFFIIDDEFFQFDTGNSLRFTGGGAALIDGTIITINEPAGQIRLEFENDDIGDGLEEFGTFAVNYDNASTAIDLAQAVEDRVTALRGIGTTSVVATRIGELVAFENDNTVSLTEEIGVDVRAALNNAGTTRSNTAFGVSQPYATAQTRGKQIVLIPDIDPDINNFGGTVSGTPETTGFNIIVTGDGSNINDGQSIFINDGNQTIRFEFNDPSTPNGGGVANGSQAIVFESGDDGVVTPQAVIQQRIIDAINNVGGTFSITATEPRLADNPNGNMIHVGGASVTHNTAALQIIGSRDGFVDGQTVTITDSQGGLPLVLEFDYDDNTSFGTTVISFGTGRTYDAIMTDIITAINASGLVVNPVDLGLMNFANTNTQAGGALQLSSGAIIEGDVGEAPIVQALRGSQIGGGNAEARTFTVTTAAGPITFEFDTGAGDVSSRANILIPISGADSAPTVAQKMSVAIEAYTTATTDVVGDRIVINGQDARQTFTLPHDLFNAGTSSMRTETLKNYLPDPQNPTNRDLEGFLRGYEETFTVDEIGRALSQGRNGFVQVGGNFVAVDGINVGQQIDNSRNAFGQTIQLTVPDHDIGGTETVFVEGVQGHEAANGIFTTFGVNQNTIELVGTRGTALVSQRYQASNADVVYEEYASGDGDRLNILAADSIDFSGAPIFQDNLTNPASPGAGTAGQATIALKAADTGADIAQRVAQRIEAVLFPNVTATSNGANFTLLNGSIIRSPFGDVLATGEGGNITGIGFIGATMFAVDDNGGFYRVNNHTASGRGIGATATFITDHPVSFSGLTEAPDDLNGGIYSNLLFASDVNGRLYALDAAGTMQPIFVDGQTSVQITDANGGAVGNINGLAFSNLDVNLWHTTTNRRADAGHGINVTHNNTRTMEVEGGASLWFGFESNAANGISGPRLQDVQGANTLRQIENTYNFAGGAHGSIESKEFSLLGYSANDDPVLYFNYFLDTEGTNFTNPNDPMRDSFRVSVVGEDGFWHLLATNNSYRQANTVNDEFDYGATSGTQVQELFDEVNGNSNGWRQARVSLAGFAGQENLRLRFEFATAGEVNSGDPNTTGEELRAIPGTDLRDGQTFSIDGTTFEFDMGFTVTPNIGSVIADGDTITIAGTIFEFNKSGGTGGGRPPINISDLDSALDVADAIVAAANSIGIAGVIQNGNRLNFKNVPVSATGASVAVEGGIGVSGGNTIVDIDASMTSDQVALAIQTSLANAFSGGDISVIPLFGEVNRIIGHTVTDAGPLGLTSGQPGDRTYDAIVGGDGDRHGSFYASNAPGTTYPNLSASLTGVDNAHEGVYIDDIIIGFAERGELVTASSGDSSFVVDPSAPSTAIPNGAYDLEIRRGAQAGILDNGQLVYFRTFDTNARQAEGVTLVAPSADQLIDGQTFTLSDGVNTLTFEYEDVNLDNDVAPGNIEIPFNAAVNTTAMTGSGASTNFTAQPDFVVAAAIRDAINSIDTQNVLDITAAASTGEVTGPTTSNLINLFGNVSGSVFPTFDLGDIDTINYGEGEHAFSGDKNRFRDQGQIIIDSNTVSESSSFGIQVDAGRRNQLGLYLTDPGPGTDLPHAGPTRTLRELNTQRLAPGVTIVNNLLVKNRGGGIIFSGDDTGSQLASVPFGRIVNNTIFGDNVVNTGSPDVDVIFLIDTSSSMQDVINELKAQIGSLDTSLLAEGLNPRYGFVEFPNSQTASTDPFLSQDLTTFADFTRPAGPFANLQVTEGLERGSVAVREALNDFNTSTTVNFTPGAKPALIVVTDEPDGSTNDDFAAAQTLVASSNSVFHAIVDPSFGNTQVTYGRLASNSGGTIFDIEDLRDDSNFFDTIVDSVVNSLSGIVVGAGIRVEENASPTLLNNIVSNLVTGIEVDSTSTSTVIGGTIYKNNTNNTQGTGLGNFARVLTDADPLFVNANMGNFIPAAGSPAIDSSVNSLEDRPALVTVRNPLGIELSPIIVRARDLTGQLRADDPSTPNTGGVGADPFKDRGAIDRVDFQGPLALLINPQDNDSEGTDLEPASTVVQLSPTTVLSNFEIELSDNGGIADNTVVSEHVRLTRDGQVLVDSVDYSFSYNATSDTIRLTPLAGIWPTNSVYVIDLNNSDRFDLVPPAGSEIPDGAQLEIVDAFDTTELLEFESGYTLLIPQTTTLLVPVEGAMPGGIADQETFTVTNGVGQPVTFEFDSDGISSGLNRAILIDPDTDTQDSIAAKIITQLEDPALGLSPKYLGDGAIHLGVNDSHVVDTSSTVMAQAGQADGVNEGETFTIDDGTKIVTFEFNNTDSADPTVAADNTAINFTLAQTNEEIAAIVANVIRNANVGLETYTTHRGIESSPTALGEGFIHLGGTVNHQVDAGTTEMIVLGKPGVAAPFGIKLATSAGDLSDILDGDSFVLGDGIGNTRRFEFDNDGSAQIGSTAIPFDVDTTADELADLVILAVQNASLGFTPTKIYDRAGLGAIALGGTEQSLLVISSDGVERLGSPGDKGAVEVRVSPVPSFDASQIAVAIENAVEVSALQEVTARLSDNALVSIEGAVNVTDLNKVFGGNQFSQSIKDLAGNDLQPNQLNGQTKFTIILGQSNVDFGDAPDNGIGTEPRDSYPTLIGNNGAGHVAVGVQLGAVRDIEANGQPSADASADENVLISTASSTGLNSTGASIAVSSEGGNIINDGDTFTISSPGGTRTFEFNAVGGSLNDVSNAEVSFTSGDDQATVVLSIINAVTTASIGLSPVHIGDGIVSLGGDEDGVIFDTAFNATVATQLRVVASDVGLLDAWIDFNRDGDWDDPFEQVFANQQLTAGVNSLVIDTSALPAGVALAGTTYARFRVSSSGGLRPTGIAADGEVEDYQVDIIEGTPPVAADDIIPGSTSASVVFNSTVSLFANDDDAEDKNSIRLLAADGTSAGGAAITVDPRTFGTGGGTFTYDPTVVSATGIKALADGETLDDTFTYRVTDGLLASDSATVTITVVGINDAPTASDFGISAVQGGTSGPHTFQGDDPDSDDTALTLSYSIVTPPSQGSVTINGTSFTFNTGSDFDDLADGETRSVTFTYQSNDGTLNSTTVGTVTVSVTGTNDAPTANNIGDPTPLMAMEDGDPITVAFAGSDIDNDALTYNLLTTPGIGRGLVINNDDGTFTYDPRKDIDFQALAAGERTSVGFSYQAVDSSNVPSNVAVVTISVEGKNDAPVALPNSYVVSQTAVLNNRNFVTDVQAGVGADNDVDNNSGIQVTDVVTAGSGLGTRTLPSGAVLTVNGNGSGSFAYDPRPIDDSQFTNGQFIETFDYFITDGTETSSATVSITVLDVDQNPVGSNDSYVLAEGGTLTTTDTTGDTPDPNDDSVRLNDQGDPEGNSVRVEVETNPQHASSFTLNTDGTFTYTHDGSQNLSDFFTYRLVDNVSGARSTPITAAFTMTNVNDAPTALPDGPFSVQAGGTLTTSAGQSVLANDSDDEGDLLTAVLRTGPQSAVSFALNSDGTFTYTHDDSASLTDSFTYVARDSSGAESDPVTVTINITPAPASPWQNQRVVGGVKQIWDVNDQGGVTLLDALIVINFVNKFPQYRGEAAGGQDLPTPPFDIDQNGTLDPTPGNGPYLDVDGDGNTDINDAIFIIREINQRRANSEDEGEGSLDVLASSPASFDVGLLGSSNSDESSRQPRPASPVAAPVDEPGQTFDPVAKFEEALDFLAEDLVSVSSGASEVDLIFGENADDDIFGLKG